MPYHYGTLISAETRPVGLTPTGFGPEAVKRRPRRPTQVRPTGVVGAALEQQAAQRELQRGAGLLPGGGSPIQALLALQRAQGLLSQAAAPKKVRPRAITAPARSSWETFNPFQRALERRAKRGSAPTSPASLRAKAQALRAGALF